MPGKMSAQMTAKIVIASAERLIAGVATCARKMKRMALMSVPAWPMPTHQTKFVMSHGPVDRETVFPQTPTPR